MKSWRWIMLFLGAGIIAATACTTKTEDDDDDDGTSTGTAAATGTPAGTTTGTATTTGTGTGGTTNPCAGAVDLGVGETTECQDCIATNCCNEYQACASGSCDGLFACASGSGACVQQCQYPICDSGYAYSFFKDCADCEGASCCDEIKTCIDDPNCLSCFTGTDSACDQTTLDEDKDNCSSTNCSEECFTDLGGGSPGTGGSGGGAG